jgi:hypothetical protein
VGTSARFAVAIDCVRQLEIKLGKEKLVERQRSVDVHISDESVDMGAGRKRDGKKQHSWCVSIETCAGGATTKWPNTKMMKQRWRGAARQGELSSAEKWSLGNSATPPSFSNASLCFTS